MADPIYHFDIEQNTPEWDAIRAGKWGSSSAATIMGGIDTKGLSDLVMTVAWGRVYGSLDEPSYRSSAMDRGHALEQSTRDSYMFQTDRMIETCGFVEHASITHVGWSPDGLVGRKHGIEAKNPLHKAWMECLRTQKIPAEYRWQCKWAQWVGQLESMHFLCDHPKAGLIILDVPALTSSEAEQMEERVHMLEERVAVWVDLLMSRQA
jgi:hypothetical protein